MSDSIEYYLPRSGRIVDESGNYVYEGAAIELEKFSRPAKASREGTIYRAYYYSTNLVDGTYLFYIDIPSNVELIGFTRASEIRAASITSEFLVITGAVDSVYSMSGWNFDETLGGNQSQSVLREATSFVDASARTPPRPIISGSTGPVRLPSSQTESGFQPKFNSSYLPAFRYVVTGGPATYFGLELTWQEIVV